MAEDLDLLDPPPLTVVAGGESFAVTPIRLGALPAVVRTLGGVRLPSDDLDLVALMAAHGEQVLAAAGIAAGIALDRVARFEPHEAVDLVTKVLQANAGMFEPPHDADGKPLDWVDAITRLVANGHRYPELLDYTVPQCRAFLRAIGRMERERSRIALMVGRGAQATKEGYEAVMAALADE